LYKSGRTEEAGRVLEGLKGGDGDVGEEEERAIQVLEAQTVCSISLRMQLINWKLSVCWTG